MTVEEFSNEFDALVSSYRRFKGLDPQELLDSIEFNEYEKSIFLTKALEDIVKNLYSGKLTGDSFERTEELRRLLDYLVKLIVYTDKIESNQIINDLYYHLVYKLPKNCWYIVFEQSSISSDNTCINNKVTDVIPVTHDNYYRIKNNPFRGPNNNRVLRLDNGDSLIELISKFPVSIYTIRYLSKPEPIILAKLPEESIDGINTVLTCKLAESLHRDILERAVQIALSTKINTTNNKDKS